MSESGRFASLSRHATGLRPEVRNALIAAGICLGSLVLVVAAGDMIGPPTNADLAEALARGG